MPIRRASPKLDFTPQEVEAFVKFMNEGYSIPMSAKLAGWSYVQFYTFREQHPVVMKACNEKNAYYRKRKMMA